MPTSVDMLDFCKGCAVKFKSNPSARDVQCWGCGASCASTASAPPTNDDQIPVLTYPVNMQPMPEKARYFSHSKPYHPDPYAMHPASKYHGPHLIGLSSVPVISKPSSPPPPPVRRPSPPKPRPMVPLVGKTPATTPSSSCYRTDLRLPPSVLALSTLPPPPPPPIGRPSLFKAGPIVPLVGKTPAKTPVPTPTVYQTLQLLLDDLNHLLYTPHEAQPFYFRGTCAIIADPAVEFVQKLGDVAQQVVERTALSFNPQTLDIQSSAHAASTITRTQALWMGGTLATSGVSCTRCRHTLSIGIERCHGPLIRGSDISGYQGQRISVDLRHWVE
ncbi:hypothetical protein FB45DRAFT_906479 [Roridomyces roridus]|uniref:Uncharacterized protein n=1 Tax=Roridomyces roridus TaxID=1738132 RepID=A0AAD7FPU7_9AGAR|nr:hypothetical protein FB45DRAFT_906479 [Roridomyces roridus]